MGKKNSNNSKTKKKFKKTNIKSGSVKKIPLENQYNDKDMELLTENKLKACEKSDLVDGGGMEMSETLSVSNQEMQESNSKLEDESEIEQQDPEKFDPIDGRGIEGSSTEELKDESEKDELKIKQLDPKKSDPIDGRGIEGSSTEELKDESEKNELEIKQLDPEKPELADIPGMEESELSLKDESENKQKYSKVLLDEFLQDQLKDAVKQYNPQNPQTIETLEKLINNPNIEINYKYECGNHIMHLAISRAVHIKDTKILELLLKNDKININATNGNSQTSIMFACSLYGMHNKDIILNIVKLLAQHSKIDFNIENEKNNQNVLIYAAKSNKFDIVKELLQYKDKFNINHKDNHGKTVLDYALEMNSNDSLNIAKELLEYKEIKLNDKTITNFINKIVNLVDANSDIFKNLISNKKINLNQFVENKDFSDNVINKVIDSKNLELLKQLLINYKDICTDTKKNNNPIIFHIFEKIDFKILKALISDNDILKNYIDKQADQSFLKDKDGNPLVHLVADLALKNDDLESLKKLLDHYPDTSFNVKYKHKNIADNIVKLALNQDDLEILTTLFTKYQNLNITSNLLCQVAKKNNIELLQLLFKCDKIKNALDTIAIKTIIEHYFQQEILQGKQLKDKKSTNAEIKEQTESTDKQLTQEQQAIIQLLIGQGLNTKIEGLSYTIFQYVLSNFDDFTVLKQFLLLTEDIKINDAFIKIDKKLSTSLEYAINKNSLDLVKLLLKYKGIEVKFELIKNLLAKIIGMSQKDTFFNTKKEILKELSDYIPELNLNTGNKEDINYAFFIVNNFKATDKIFEKLIFENKTNIEIVQESTGKYGNNKNLYLAHTVIDKAISSQDLELLKRLLIEHKDAYFNTKDKNNNLIIINIINNNNIEILKKLFKDNNIVKYFIENKDKDDYPVIYHVATLCNDLELLEQLLNDYKETYLTIDNTDKNPIICKIFEKIDFKILKALISDNDILKNYIDKQADESFLKDKDGNPLVHLVADLALKNNDLESLKKLLDHYPDTSFNVEHKDIAKRIVKIALNQDDLKILTTLFTKYKDLDPNIKNNSSKPFLHLVVEKKDNELLKILINYDKIDLNIKDSFNNTPLHIAIKNKNIEALKELLSKEGIDVNLQNDFKNTPLHIAAKNKNIEALKELLRKEGIDVNLQNEKDDAPLHIAVENNNIEALKELLRKEGIDVNLQNEKDDAPLHIAVENNNIEALKELLRKEGIDVNLQNDDKNTLFHIAVINITKKEFYKQYKENAKELSLEQLISKKLNNVLLFKELFSNIQEEAFFTKIKFNIQNNNSKSIFNLISDLSTNISEIYNVYKDSINDSNKKDLRTMDLSKELESSELNSSLEKLENLKKDLKKEIQEINELSQKLIDFIKQKINDENDENDGKITDENDDNNVEGKIHNIGREEEDEEEKKEEVAVGVGAKKEVVAANEDEDKKEVENKGKGKEEGDEVRNEDEEKEDKVVVVVAAEGGGVEEVKEIKEGEGVVVNKEEVAEGGVGGANNDNSYQKKQIEESVIEDQTSILKTKESDRKLEITGSDQKLETDIKSEEKKEILNLACIQAIKDTNLKKLKCAIDNGVILNDLTIYDDNNINYTLLQYTIIFNKKILIETLINSGVNVNATGSSNENYTKDNNLPPLIILLKRIKYVYLHESREIYDLVKILELLLDKADIEINDIFKYKYNQNDTIFNLLFDKLPLRDKDIRIEYKKVITRILQHEKIDINIQNDNLQTPIMLVLSNYKEDLYEYEHYTNEEYNLSTLSFIKILTKNEKIKFDIVDQNKKNVLIYAAQYATLNIVKELLKYKHKFDINSKDKDDKTAIDYALENNKLDIVEELLKCEEIKNSLSLDKITNIIKNLIKTSDLKLQKNIFKLLQTTKTVKEEREIVKNNLIKDICELLSNNTTDQIEAKQDDSIKVLEYVILNSKKEIIEFLIFLGINLNIKNTEGYTPIMMAVKNIGKNTDEIIDLLLSDVKTDEDSNAKTNEVSNPKTDEDSNANIDKDLNALMLDEIQGQQYTIFQYVLLKNQNNNQNLQILKKFLKLNKGIKINDTFVYAKNKYTPLTYAISKKHKKLVQELLKYESIDVNLQLNNYDNALSIIVKNGNQKLLKALIKSEQSKKIDLNIKYNGDTIFNLVDKFSKNKNKIKTLLEGLKQKQKVLQSEQGITNSFQSGQDITNPFEEHQKKSQTSSIEQGDNKKSTLELPYKSEYTWEAERKQCSEDQQSESEEEHELIKKPRAESSLQSFSENTKQPEKIMQNDDQNNLNQSLPTKKQELAQTTQITEEEMNLQHNTLKDSSKDTSEISKLKIIESQIATDKAIETHGQSNPKKEEEKQLELQFKELIKLIIDSYKDKSQNHDFQMQIEELINFIINVYKLNPVKESDDNLDTLEKLINNTDLESKDDLFDLKDKYGNNILHIIAKHNNLEVLKKLINNYPNIDFNAQNCFGNTAFHIAAEHNNLKLLKYLIDNKKIDPNIPNDNGDTVLHIIAKNNHLTALKKLINNYPDINFNTKNKVGNTLLHIAIENNSSEMFEKLISYSYDEDGKIDINLKDNFGNTPLHLAVGYNNIKALEILMNHSKIDPNSGAPIHRTIENKSSEMFEKLISYDIHKKIDINLKDNSGNTFLHLAVIHENTKALEILMNHSKIDPNIQDNNGNTPLHMAIENNSSEMFEKLISYSYDKDGKIDINLKDNLGNTPLYLAVGYNNIKALEILMNHPKIDLNIQDNNGNTPLHLAVSNDRIKALEILMKHPRIEFNIQDDNENTFLHCIVGYKKINMLKIVLDSNFNKKIDFDIKNQDNETVFDLAKQIKDNKIEDLLEKIKTKQDSIDKSIVKSDENAEEHILVVDSKHQDKNIPLAETVAKSILVTSVANVIPEHQNQDIKLSDRIVSKDAQSILFKSEENISEQGSEEALRSGLENKSEQRSGSVQINQLRRGNESELIIQSEQRSGSVQIEESRSVQTNELVQENEEAQSGLENQLVLLRSRLENQLAQGSESEELESKNESRRGNESSGREVQSEQGSELELGNELILSPSERGNQPEQGRGLEQIYELRQGNELVSSRSEIENQPVQERALGQINESGLENQLEQGTEEASQSEQKTEEAQSEKGSELAQSGRGNGLEIEQGQVIESIQSQLQSAQDESEQGSVLEESEPKNELGRGNEEAQSGQSEQVSGLEELEPENESGQVRLDTVQESKEAQLVQRNRSVQENKLVQQQKEKDTDKKEKNISLDIAKTNNIDAAKVEAIKVPTKETEAKKIEKDINLDIAKAFEIATEEYGTSNIEEIITIAKAIEVSYEKDINLDVEKAFEIATEEYGTSNREKIINIARAIEVSYEKDINLDVEKAFEIATEEYGTSNREKIINIARAIEVSIEEYQATIGKIIDFDN
ncbi:MAG: ankyrin repeat domain-containing protein [Rickettsiales bacterium]